MIAYDRMVQNCDLDLAGLRMIVERVFGPLNIQAFGTDRQSATDHGADFKPSS